jgi:DNA primase
VLVEGYFDVIALHQAGVANAVGVCGTALTAEHLELLARCDCREVTVLFDGDVAGLAAPARAAQAILPSGIAGKVAVLPAEGGKTDPDELARAKGRAGVEALLAAAVPLTEFLIERAIEHARNVGRAKGQPEEAGPERAGGPGGPRPPGSMEGKVAAFRELRPFLALTPGGLARTAFEERIAARLGVAPGALQAELAAPARNGRSARAAGPARAARGSRVRVMLASPAVDALGILAAHPDLAPAADDEGLVHVLPAGPVAEAGRALLSGELGAREAVERLDGVLEAAPLLRLRQIALGPAGPGRETAERELRRAVVKARIEQQELEHERLSAAVARAGSPAPGELVKEQLELVARLRDLRRRLAGLERP